jgi:DMSO/TMAO reductase YedYZ molybdopterin-dependent catalytic subunit
MFTRLLIASALVLSLGLVGCGQSQETASTTAGTGLITSATAPAGTMTTTASETTTTTAATSSASEPGPTPSTSESEPIDVPTLPAEIPGYTEVDPDTGLHVTGTPQVIDLADYRLKVSGKVAQALDLTYDEIRSLPKVTATPTLVCPGFFNDTATWSGVPIRTILEMAGVQPDAKRITLTAADGYGTSVSLEEALQPKNFLAYDLMDEPVPVLHGFPLRAVFPDKYGSYWVKWLLEIKVE